MYVYVRRIHAMNAWMPVEDQKRALKALQLELQTVVNPPAWVLGTELRPLEKQELLTSKPSPQS